MTHTSFNKVTGCVLFHPRMCRKFLSSKVSKPVLESTQHLTNGEKRSFPEYNEDRQTDRQCCWTHLHLVPKLRIFHPSPDLHGIRQSHHYLLEETNYGHSANARSFTD
jgi:hypothetical protein